MVALREDERQHRRRPHWRQIGQRPPLRIVEAQPLELVRRDTLPEHADYRDTGCELSASCLSCPLARCQYDERGGVRRLVASARDREIVLIRTRYAAPINQLATTYGLTRRSIFRILAHGRRWEARGAQSAVGGRKSEVRSER